MHDDISDARRWTMLVCSMIAAMTTTCVVSGVPYLIPTLHTGEGLAHHRLRHRHRADHRTDDRHHSVGRAARPLRRTAGADGIAVGNAGGCRRLGGSGARRRTDGGAGGVPVRRRAVVGAANGASGRIVVGWFPANQRGTAMGFRQMAQPLGMGLCALTMPVIAAAHGVGAALIVPAVVTAIGLACCVFGIKDPPMRTEPAGATGAAQPVTPAENPYRASSFLARVHAVSVALVIPQSMLWTFVPTWLIVDRGWAPATAEPSSPQRRSLARWAGSEPGGCRM